MSVLCNFSLSPPPQTILTSSSPSLSSLNNYNHTSLKWPQKTLIGALTGVLSVGLLISSPSSPVLAQTSTLDQSPSSELCTDDKTQEIPDTAPDIVSNEEIVKEAWQIVNDSFIDSGRNRWSPETWLKKKEDILSTSIKTRSKAHDIITRMLASLGDPYTRYLSPPEFSKMGRYDMTGIGINLREVPGENGDVKLKVLGLILDGPAHSAGVRQGDEVLAVNGMDVRGKSSFEVSSLIQGPNETLVNIKVKHGNCGPVQSIEIQRQSIARSPVLYRLEKIDNGATSVGYIRLKEFNALAKKDLLTAMKRLQSSGASSFVLDLRDNRGGLVQAGVEIAKLFLNEGETVISTVGRDSLDERSIITDTRPLTTAPTIVLVNQNTASASEIVASALHDNCKAVLVGETTFGKGLIQSVYELRDGSGVVVTVGKYVTPNHKDINGNGIEPDFQSMPAWSEVSKRLSECSRSREG
ncbi:carboxyl-terminal-processing peptidase 1, chloroplastic [Impatiens glandulifera]|uniref:carboxyl-terminal-processing peptidase 1, chloroplastic n=1 Tax=Impatiens glandulifera TaxID=253017 RepID=UPI001FB0538A|nr:carboxyl-terminal-processing peptidase 1, chloroplastic [Impatiens glandulifera]